MARGRGELKEADDRHQQYVEQSMRAAEELQQQAARERQSASRMSQRLLQEQTANAGASGHLRDLNQQMLVEVKLRMQLQEGERSGRSPTRTVHCALTLSRWGRQGV